MPHKLITFLLFFFACNAADAQFNKNVAEYYKNMNAGKICFVKKSYDSAVNYYQKAFTYLHPDKREYQEIAQWCDLAKRDTDAIYYFKMGALNGMRYRDTSTYPNYYRAKRKTTEYLSFAKELDSLAKEFQKNMNLEFCFLIKTLYTKDKVIRDGDFIYNKDNAVKDFSQQKLKEINNDNIDELLDYFETDGVPYSYTLSQEITDNFQMLVRHQVTSNVDSIKKQKLKKAIAKAIYEGHLPNTFLYPALDDEHMLCCRKELYGTNADKRLDQKWNYVNIEEPEKTDTRRAQWMLLPLYWSMHFDFGDYYFLPYGYTFKE